jgi:hypothetical protein
MKVALLFVGGLICQGIDPYKYRTIRVSSPLWLASPEDDSAAVPSLGSGFKRNADGSFTDTSSVDFILGEIKTMLKPTAPLGSGKGQDPGVNEDDLSAQYSALLAQLGGKDAATVKTELTMLQQNLEQGGIDSITDFKALGASGTLSTPTPRTALYSAATAPYCVVYGDGPVGTRVIEMLKGLEPAAKFKRIDGKSLAVMQDTELTFALRDVRTILVCTDTAASQPTGWFAEEPTPILDQKKLKRLLNAAMAERNRGSVPNIRVVVLGKAAAVKKGLASILLSGDAGTVESEVWYRRLNSNCTPSVVVNAAIGDPPVPSPRSRV